MIHQSKLQSVFRIGGRFRSLMWFLTILGISTASAGQIYWSTASKNASYESSGYIIRANADGTGSVPVLSTTELKPIRSTLADAAIGKMYWTLWDGTVQRANIDGTNIETILPATPYPNVHLVAIDSANGKLYFYNNVAFMRANLDGTGVEIIVSDEGTFAVDWSANKVYWLTSNQSFSHSVYRADLTGANQEHLFDINDSAYVTLLGFESTNAKLYWHERNLCNGQIRRSDVDGGNIETLVPMTDCPFDIVLDSVGQKIYWSTGDSDVQTTTRSNLDGSQVEVFLSNASGEYYEAISVDGGAGKLYWTSPDSIRRVNVDGSDLEYNVTRHLLEPAGIALDADLGHLYWVDIAAGTIMRADMSGANPVVLLSEAELISPFLLGWQNGAGGRIKRDIKLDLSAGKMYWTTSHAIHRSDLDGTSLELVHSTGANEPVGLSLDLSAGKVYWTELIPAPNLNVSPLGRVVRANLDGTGVEAVTGDDLITPTGIDLHPTTGKLFWVNSLSTIELFSANLDGSNAEELVDHGLSLSHLLAVDAESEHIYLANGSRIHRFNFDGTDAQIIESGYGAPIGIALDAPLCELTYSYGDVNYSGGTVNLDDILCVISGFANSAACPGADISPCYQNGVIDLSDILAELGAFAGNSSCADRCAP